MGRNHALSWSFTTVSSPVGDLRLVSDGQGLSAIYFENHQGEPEPQTPWARVDDDPILAEAAKQLDEYFRGDRHAFDLELSLHGTDFQKRVWGELKGIPWGETTSYGAIASRVGSIKGSRAVGGAVGKNPVSIVLPCHRVIGANDSLTGFAGGLDRKRWLLKHEGAAVSRKKAQAEFALSGA